GQATLAGWLLAPAEPETVRARQAAVAELRERVDLREDLALLGAEVRAELHPERLQAWGEAPPVPFASSHRVVAPVLVALVLVGLGLWILTGAGPIPFLLAVTAEAGYALVLRPRIVPILRAVDAPVRELDLFARLLARIEAESFTSGRLRALRDTLETGGLPPSRRIARLHRRLELLDARRNHHFAPVAALLLWATQLGMAVERWRRRCGPSLGAWIDAAGEFEALCSLAGLAFERPDWCFPQLHVGTPRFEADGLGHPLIPPERCVRNDVALGDGAPQVLVVSGSNMSGKSTLLRSIGVAAVLAQAGAPVFARRLALSPLHVGASIRIQDSIQRGTSHFYAEITRVRRVMELAEAGPTLFLLDEIFHGTNSHDRGIGAEAVVQGLIERGAIGLVTTHDLALAKVADRLAPRTANVHFEDHVEEGRMVFDYRMREGVVTKSNAIALMRAVGLPV
ncbi:MAG: DNA mismatch repair protein MutS, partial [Myxococcota bacterium]|nr:DNA mismatch repair protein MutS [Myxococcota bacterium]